MASFSRILQALGCFDSASGPKGGPPPEHEQWAIHAVQSFVWKIAGILLNISPWVHSSRTCLLVMIRLTLVTNIGPISLSEPEENIILSFTEPGGPSEARWDAYRSRAERVGSSYFRASNQ